MSAFTPCPASSYASTPEEQKDSSALASEEGFTGTLAAFIEWLKNSLCYGGVMVSEAVSGHRPGAKVMRVETVTGGFSSDEHLLGRVQRSPLMAGNWESSHRGGLTVYVFPIYWFESTEEHEFLAPEDGVLERVRRARRVRVYSEDGGLVEFNYAAGAELVYEEPDRDIGHTNALLVVRPVGPEHALKF